MATTVKAEVPEQETKAEATSNRSVEDTVNELRGALTIRNLRTLENEWDGLIVEEQLLQPIPGGNLAYHIPKDAKDIERSDRTLRYKLS